MLLLYLLHTLKTLYDILQNAFRKRTFETFLINPISKRVENINQTVKINNLLETIVLRKFSNTCEDNVIFMTLTHLTNTTQTKPTVLRRLLWRIYLNLECPGPHALASHPIQSGGINRERSCSVQQFTFQ